jgi:hypothetical protein
MFGTRVFLSPEREMKPVGFEEDFGCLDTRCSLKIELCD